MSASRIPANIGHPSVSDEHDICDAPRIGDAIVKRVHLKGRRPSQEDADATFECDFFKYLTPEQQTLLLNNVLASVNELGRTVLLGTSGACVGLNISWQQGREVHICSANLADVSTFKILTTEDKVEEVARITESLHQVEEARSNPELAKKLKTKQFSDGESLRLEDYLIIYRSLGDYSAHQYGLEAKADIVHKLFTLKEKQSLYLLTACDGLTDAISGIKNNYNVGYFTKPEHSMYSFVLEYNGQQLPLDSIINIYKTSQQLGESKEKKIDTDKLMMEEFIRLAFQASLAQCKAARPGSREANLAWNLAQWGLTFSTDNISVMIHNPGNMAICTAIMDGHVGEEMANFIQANLETVFLNEAYKLIKIEQLRSVAPFRGEAKESSREREKRKSVLELATMIIDGLDSLPTIKPHATGKLFQSAETTLDTVELSKAAKRMFSLSAVADKKLDSFIDYITAQMMNIWNLELSRLPKLMLADKKAHSEMKEVTETDKQKNQRLFENVIKNKNNNQYMGAIFEISKLLLAIHNQYKSPDIAKLFENFPIESLAKTQVTKVQKGLS